MNALLLSLLLAQAPAVEVPILEAYAGRYQVTFQHGSEEAVTRAAWYGTLTVRTKPWKGWRLWGELETSAHSGTSQKSALATWNGGSGYAGISRDVWASGPWTTAVVAGVGATVAMGEDARRVDVTPAVGGMGLRVGYGEGSSLSWRTFSACGFRGVVLDLPDESEDAPAVNTRIVATCESDNLFSLPVLKDTVKLHARLKRTFPGSGWVGDWEFRYGIVAGW